MIKVQGKIIKTEPIQGNLIDNIEGLIKVQEKTVTPIEETQDIIPDSSYDALSKVTVNKIPDDYIIPEGTLEITTNNLYNVKNYEKASVNIELRLAEKTITKNGVYDALDDSVDGYSQVTVDIPNKVPSLVDGTITTVTAEDLEGATAIRNYAFNSCSSLTSITIPDSVTSIGSNVFKNCDNLIEVSLGNGITTLGNYLFENTYYLQRVNLPMFLIAIYFGVFNGCRSLIEITIPDSVMSIGDYAFNGCSSLTSVTVKAITPPTLSGSNAFTNTNSCPIYVPAESVNAYKAASNWSRYASRIQAIPE